MLTRAAEDYLAEIYRIEADGGQANTTDVAGRLGVTAASTSSMFRKLSLDGLVHYQEYSGVHLTVDGELRALAIIRRHRVTERFLTDMLGFSWEEVDTIAHRMEHALPDEVVERLETLLGRPQTCPHGFPIPTRQGQVDHPNLLELGSLKGGDQGVVARVHEDDPTLLEYLKKIHLTPGAQVTVVSVNDVDGTLELEVAGYRVIVGPRIAVAVAVRS